MAKAEFIGGRHYTAYVEEIHSLKRAGDYEAAEQLLLQCIDATEAEARVKRWSVAPGYYWHLAIVYRKQGRLANEMSILERYKCVAEPRGEFGGKFADRLAKVRAKLERGK